MAVAPIKVATQHETVKTTCDVRHLREIRGGLMSSWGAANVCEAACGSAMKALSLSTTDCERSQPTHVRRISPAAAGARIDAKTVLKLRIAV